MASKLVDQKLRDGKIVGLPLLCERIVVGVIIATLTAAAVPMVADAFLRARTARDTANLRTLVTTVEMYRLK